MTRRMLVHLCVVFASVLLGRSFALAQTDIIESNAGIQFDFGNPGARSLALGGAFVGLADDATAGFTNPAGLRFLSRKELSAEARNHQFVTPYTSGGRLDGSPSLLGIDTSAGLQTSDSKQSANSLAFVSFVYPTHKWAIAVYRQLVSNFRYAAESQGPFFGSNLNPNAIGRYSAYQATLSLDVARYGLSQSIALGEKTSIGIGVMLYDFSLKAESRRFGIANSREAPDFSAANLGNRQLETGAQKRAGVNAGFMVAPNPHLQLGAVFRQGAYLDVKIEQSLPRDPNVIAKVTPGTFSIPNVYGVGIVMRPNDTLKLMLDYDRVQYSSMTKNFVLSGFLSPDETPSQVDDFKAANANEVHFGLEYVFLKLVKPFALRQGVWYDPDHAVRFQPRDTQKASRFDLIFFRQGKDAVHFTGGGGMALGRFEINAGADFSSRGHIVSLSSVVRF